MRIPSTVIDTYVDLLLKAMSIMDACLEGV